MKRQNLRYLYAMLLLLFVVASCTPQKKLVYFQGTPEAAEKTPFTNPSYLIKTGDILHVRVLTLDDESYFLFNNEEQRLSGGGGGRQQNNISIYLNGYTVYEDGQIQIPVVGKIPVAGLTLNQATDSIAQRIDQYSKGATVVVKMANFSITVLGEVKRPGNFYVYDNEITIIDALGLAGDLTDYGNRKIKVARQTADGMIFGELDITSKKSISSEFFFLQPNDLVYVEPLYAKRLGFNQFPFSVLFSAISTTILLWNLLK